MSNSEFLTLARRDTPSFLQHWAIQTTSLSDAELALELQKEIEEVAGFSRDDTEHDWVLGRIAYVATPSHVVSGSTGG